jgi:hypothetical protein
VRGSAGSIGQESAGGAIVFIRVDLE